MGTTEFSGVPAYTPKLWSLLSGSIDEWYREYCEKNANVGAQSFFRTYHARLRRKIQAVHSEHSRD